MSMPYSSFITALGVVLIYPITDPSAKNPSSNNDFNSFLPRIIEGAEERIYRELDFLFTRREDFSTTLITTSRNQSVPVSTYTVQSAQVVTPAGAQPYTNGAELVPLEIVSKDFIDHIWPRPSVNKGVPRYIAFVSQNTAIVAPTPDQTYKMMYTGTFRPVPLAYDNTDTYLTQFYPDLFLYASLVVAMGYQRDYGAQSDDPKMAMSWETMYQTAKASAMAEELRRNPERAPDPQARR